MNITDIQLEIRKIGAQLTALEAELEALKPSKKNINESVFKETERLAKKMPIVNRNLKEADESTKKRYIQFLSILAQNEGEDISDKLLFICRIAYGADYNVPIKEILTLGLDVNKNTVDDIIIAVGEHYLSLIADSLIISSLNGTPDEDSIDMIITLAEAVNCSKEDMKVISTVAACVLKSNFDELDKLNINSNKYMGIFTHHIPEEWLAKRRNILNHSNFYTYNFFIQPGAAVKKGQNIGSFKNKSYFMWEKDFNAPTSGIIYINYFVNEKVYYIVNYFDSKYNIKKFADEIAKK